MDILVVGGSLESDEQGPFGGRSGRYLRNVLSNNNIQAQYTNVCNYHPRSESGRLRAPTRTEIDVGRIKLYAFIREHKPKLVVGLGGVALAALKGHGLQLNEHRKLFDLDCIRREGKTIKLGFAVDPARAIKYQLTDQLEEDIKFYFKAAAA